VNPRTVAALGGLLWAAGLGCGGDSAPAGGLTYIYGGAINQNVDNGSIIAADPRSGRTTTLVTFPVTGPDFLGTLRFDGTNATYSVYNFPVPGGPATTVSTIQSIGLAGGTPTTLVTGLDTVDAIAADDTSIYFTDYFIDANYDQSSAVSFVGKAPLGGGSFVKLVDGIPGRVEGVAVGGGFVYWSNANAGTINRVSTAGDDPTVLATGQGVVYPPQLTADDSGVYWVSVGSTFVDCDFLDGSIQSVPTGSADPVTVVGAIDNPTTIVASAGSVYFTMLGPRGCNSPSELPPSGAVVQASVQNGADVVLASGLDTPFNLFITGGVVDYTTTSGPHAVPAEP
jgi:hypothetical protein